MSAPRTSRSILVLATVLTALVLAAPVAWAAGEAAEAAAEPGPGKVLAIALLAVLFAVGTGCLVAVLRVVFPGPAAKADAALERLGTGRLLLTGLLPVVGIGLLGAAAAATHVQALTAVWAIVLFLPAALLMLVGALAAVPHLGGALLRTREERSLLARSVVGTVALGLALGATAAVPPLVHFVAMILAGWFLGAGLGVVFRPAAASEEAAPTLEDAD